MKSIKYILPLIVVLFSCQSEYLIQKKLQLDSGTDVYAVRKILKKEIKDFELNATVQFESGYRDNKTGWAGFLVRTNKENGLHGKDEGYLVFVRENGEIGVHSSKGTSKKVRMDKQLEGVFPNDKILIKITSRADALTIFVNGNKKFSISGIELKGNYISANAGGANVNMRIKSLKD
jgi:hypothetical protein